VRINKQIKMVAGPRNHKKPRQLKKLAGFLFAVIVVVQGLHASKIAMELDIDSIGRTGRRDQHDAVNRGQIHRLYDLRGMPKMS
jgi:hypothetical protein